MRNTQNNLSSALTSDVMSINAPNVFSNRNYTGKIISKPLEPKYSLFTQQMFRLFNDTQNFQLLESNVQTPDLADQLFDLNIQNGLSMAKMQSVLSEKAEFVQEALDITKTGRSVRTATGRR